jgi:hypothetical protein
LIKRLLHYHFYETNEIIQSSGINWSLSIIFLEQLTHQFFLANVADQETFEREIGCLRTLFQQQQQQQQCVPQLQAPAHSHSNSKDLDSQFADLSQHNDPSSGHDAISSLRIKIPLFQTLDI